MTRFRRTKEEIALGYSPERAMEFRRTGIHEPAGPPLEPEVRRKIVAAIDKVRGKPTGEVIIRIRPAKGVDADFFEFIKGKEIVVEQDNKFYSWLDHIARRVYDEAGQEKLFQDLLDKGIGEVIKNGNS